MRCCGRTRGYVLPIALLVMTAIGLLIIQVMELVNLESNTILELSRVERASQLAESAVNIALYRLGRDSKYTGEVIRRLETEAASVVVVPDEKEKGLFRIVALAEVGAGVRPARIAFEAFAIFGKAKAGTRQVVLLRLRQFSPRSAQLMLSDLRVGQARHDDKADAVTVSADP